MEKHIAVYLPLLDGGKHVTVLRRDPARRKIGRAALGCHDAKHGERRALNWRVWISRAWKGLGSSPTSPRGLFAVGMKGGCKDGWMRRQKKHREKSRSY